MTPRRLATRPWLGGSIKQGNWLSLETETGKCCAGDLNRRILGGFVPGLVAVRASETHLTHGPVEARLRVSVTSDTSTALHGR